MVLPREEPVSFPWEKSPNGTEDRFFFVIVLLCSGAARAQSLLAVPVDGEPFAARLTSIDAQGKLGFDVGGKPRTLAAEDLVAWGQPAELRKGPILVLADGGFLPAAVFGCGEG